MARHPRLEAALQFAGIEPCNGSPCMFGNGPGMHTNGGCRCADRRAMGHTERRRRRRERRAA